MTRKTSTFAHVLTVVAFFLAIITPLVAIAALAQQDAQIPAESSAALITQQARAPMHFGSKSGVPMRPSRWISSRSAEAESGAVSPLDAGSVSFLPAMNYSSGGESPGSVAIADVNGDGKLDLVVANTICPFYCFSVQNGSVGILLANGDGTFQPVVTYDTGGTFAMSVVVADVNGDGKPDVIVTHACWVKSCLSKTGVSVLLGNGDGTFRPAVTYNSGAPESFSVAVADVNADGKPDLLVATNCFPDTCGYPTPTHGVISVLLGNGDGTFLAPVTYDSGGIGANSLAAVDLNGDGKIDVLVANAGTLGGSFYNSGSLGVLLGNGDGTFQAPVTYAAGPIPWFVTVADVNGDGRLDALVPASCWCGRDAEISVLLGNGDGTFGPVVTYDSGGMDTLSLTVSDVNGDGKPDLLALSMCNPWIECDSHGDDVLGVFLGNGDGTFQPPLIFTTPPGIPIVAADLNGDGKPDVVLTNTTPPGFVSVLLNNTASSETPTSATLASALNPSIFGQTVVLTARVASNSGTPTGTVQILNGSTVVGSGTLSSGIISIPVSTLPAGTDLVTASYLGGGGFAPSKSAPLTQTVTKAATATALASSPNPAAANQAITFTAAVSSQYDGAATGTVTFMAGAQNLGSAALSGNVASLTTSFATAGTYAITAQYNGDSNNTGSTSAALSEKIIASTTTTLTSSLNPSVVAQAVTFTATVASSGGMPPNGETITFYNGWTVMGTAPLSGGAAALTTSALPAGVFTITARYPGDSNFAASTSAGLMQTVNATTKSATATLLTSSLNPSIYGQKVTFTARVTTSGPVPPTGTVVFMWRYFTETYTLGTATLNSAGVATLAKSNLNADPYPMAAVYRGDTNNLSSTSAVLNQTVLQTTSAAALTSSLNPSTVGQAITFTAKITSPTVMPSGPVTFKAGTTVLGTAQLSSGEAIFTTSTLPAGSTVVKVIYNGDSNIKGSSASVAQTVQP